MPVDDVEMVVRPNTNIPLRMINDQLRENAPKEEINPLPEAKDEKLDPKDEARRLMVKAELIQQEAEELLERAKELAPTLFTKERGRPKKTEAEKAKAKADEKVKRKDRDETKRSATQEADLNRRVAEKLQRDASADVNKPNELA